MQIKKSILELIGKTPLVELCNYEKVNGLKGKIFAKLEFFNPAGSVKDRIAYAMIEDGEKRGVIDKETVIIEPTSGNTGIGLAAVCAVKGYKCVLTMPETMSIERRKLLEYFGAEIILTEGSKGMKGSIDKAEQLHNDIKNSFIPNQFKNPANPQAHTTTTAEEIWCDTDGEVDILVAGVGSGGTISGTARGLKAKNAAIKIIAVEPASSPVLTKGYSGAHKIQGIGANFVPENLDRTLLDDILPVSDDDAFAEARKIAKTDGIMVGISSGAALFVAKTLAEKNENIGKNIVVIFPDTGARYLSTELFK